MIPWTPTVDGLSTPSGSLKVKCCSRDVKKRKSSISANCLPRHPRGPTQGIKVFYIFTNCPRGRRKQANSQLLQSYSVSLLTQRKRDDVIVPPVLSLCVQEAAGVELVGVREMFRVVVDGPQVGLKAMDTIHEHFSRSTE